MFAKLVLLGLCGALDTQASQAVGAGKHNRLPTLYQRTSLFLLLHCIPITAVMLSVPWLLYFANGQNAELSHMVYRYLTLVVPGIFLEAFGRSVSRVMCVSCLPASSSILNFPPQTT
jgi:multidrug resistance protein, MATE family